MRAVRVALLSGNYNYLREGANQALNRLVAYAERNGFKFRVYSPVTRTPAFEPAGDLVAVPSIPLPGRTEFRLAPGLPRAVRDDVRMFAPDLIHLSTPDILGTRAQTFARHLGVPVVASLHTRFETYFDFYGLGWARPPAEAHLRRFYRRSDHVLAPTPAMVAELKRLRGDEAVSLWSRGVDRDLFNPRRRDLEWRRAQGFADEDVVLLFFGRLVLEKGVRDFVAVAQRLRALGVEVKPLVVGAGPAQDAFDALEDAILTGHLEGPDLARAIASADILIHPSRTEAFGNVMLEAMASGLAVVASATQSAEALIAHGRSGLLCPPEDIDCFVAEVARLAGDARARSALGEAARTASAAFRWDDAAESVLRAYRSLVRISARQAPA
ncbi:MAG: phosphatidylinositol alpha 1,6-mannosyltransferase [Sphingomonadales bacterium]|jgi:glycosyltransferase involved in cell wall biosynthesis|nr:phosphatidylinositol alpha 1,6-mannosyltransferase [Sphingomonadales bacterium]